MNENPSFVKPENLENLFQAITEQSGDGISLADTKGNYIFVNAAFSEITGYCETELLKMNVHDLLPPNVQPSLFPQVVNKQPGYRETELIKKNGSCFWAEIKGYPIELKGRSLVLGIIRDISERKHYEKKLAENEEKFRILFDLSPLPISLSEMETGRIVDDNLRYDRPKASGSPDSSDSKAGNPVDPVWRTCPRNQQFHSNGDWFQ